MSRIVQLVEKAIHYICAYMSGGVFLQLVRFRILGRFHFADQLQQVFFAAICLILDKSRMRPDVACDYFRSNYLIFAMP